MLRQPAALRARAASARSRPELAAMARSSLGGAARRQAVAAPSFAAVTPSSLKAD